MSRTVTAWAPPRILVLAATGHSGSAAGRLAAAAAWTMARLDTEVTWISLADHRLPLFDADEPVLEPSEPACRLAGLFCHHDGLFITAPATNGSLATVLKNALDWVAAVKPVSEAGCGPVLAGKPVAMASVADDHAVAATALAHCHAILARLGAVFEPDQHGIALQAPQFDASGALLRTADAAQLDHLCRALPRRCR